MRITGNRLIEQSAAATARAQSAYGKAANVVTTGYAVAAPSDDPAAWLSAQRAKAHQQVVDGSTKALQAGRDRIAQTDSALASLSSIVSDVRAIAVQGSSAQYETTARANLATEVQGLFQSAVAAANTQGADGQYLLAGTRSGTAPFDNATGAYTGDATANAVPDSEAGGTSHFASIAGSQLTAAGGAVDVLPLLSRVATALAANDTATLNTALGDLDKAVQQMGGVRVRAGGLMTSIDSVTAAHGVLSQTLATAAAGYVEADTVQAASQLAQANNALQISSTVSQSVIASIGKLTQ